MLACYDEARLVFELYIYKKNMERLNFLILYYKRDENTKKEKNLALKR